MFTVRSGKLYFTRRGETVCIFAQGKDGIRVQSTMNAALDSVDWALEGAEAGVPVVSVDETSAELTNGRLKVTVDRLGKMRFFRDGALILEEYYRCYEYDMPHTPSLRILAREYRPIRGGDYAFTLRFEARDEKLFGMGQYQEARLDLKGCTLELAQRNTQVSVPFLVSSLGYGFLWNNPAVGRSRLRTT